MEEILIGRKEEIEILEDALDSGRADMVAVIGRRRVGKTFLIKSIYKERIMYEVTGMQHADRLGQLQNFMNQIYKYSGGKFPPTQPKNWLDAFFLLSNYLDSVLDDKKRSVIFFDELPWMATHKSGFLMGLSWFWNSWAVNKNLVVVICGSAASWMIQKVVNHRGGLYNRITKYVYLYPFTLAETEEYLKARNLHFNRYQIVQLYMALGGIPHYLEEIKGGKSAVQNINQICFAQSAPLREEFSRLYPALFANADQHIKIIRTLARKWQGMTRQEVSRLSKVNGGSLSRVLSELIHSGFISSYRPFGKKKKNRLYRLTDEYSLFYLQFIEGKEYEGKNIWHHLSQTQTYKIWSGYAFENICLKHIPQIKKAMNIDGIFTLSSSFYQSGKNDEQGTQIDLLIDRNDGVINLFEIKFHNKIYTVSKADVENIHHKQLIFKTKTKTDKQIFFSYITTFGLNENTHSKELTGQDLTLDDLFLTEV